MLTVKPLVCFDFSSDGGFDLSVTEDQQRTVQRVAEHFVNIFT